MKVYVITDDTVTVADVMKNLVNNGRTQLAVYRTETEARLVASAYDQALNPRINLVRVRWERIATLAP